MSWTRTISGARAVPSVCLPVCALELFGVKLVGMNAENGKKLVLTLLLIAALLLMGKLLRALARTVAPRGRQTAFWARQAIHLGIGVLLVLGIVSIWFDDPSRLAMAVGLITAGLAFALQRVITAFAGYFLILRGKLFNVGDRIVMGGVRGDVVALGFMHTTILEMGQPPPVQNADPAIWVRARQYTGRLVSVSNSRLFDEPVFNYTREFPYLWEEMSVPISYHDDRHAAERILLDAARRHTVQIAELSEPVIREMERRYVMKRAAMEPRVYLRLTDSWLELTVRIIAHDHGVRELKDAMTREILRGLEQEHIAIASTTVELVGVPPLRVEQVTPQDVPQR